MNKQIGLFFGILLILLSSPHANAFLCTDLYSAKTIEPIKITRALSLHELTSGSQPVSELLFVGSHDTMSDYGKWETTTEAVREIIQFASEKAHQNEGQSIIPDETRAIIMSNRGSQIAVAARESKSEELEGTSLSLSSFLPAGRILMTESSIGYEVPNGRLSNLIENFQTDSYRPTLGNRGENNLRILLGQAKKKGAKDPLIGLTIISDLFHAKELGSKSMMNSFSRLITVADSLGGKLKLRIVLFARGNELTYKAKVDLEVLNVLLDSLRKKHPDTEITFIVSKPDTELRIPSRTN